MKTAILLAAYGSTLPAVRDILEGLRARIAALRPDMECRVACTSKQVLSMAEPGPAPWRSAPESLSQLARDGYTHVAIQSLHVIPGSEYQELLQAARACRKSGELQQVRVGRPLLSSRDDVANVASALLRSLPPLDAGQGAVVVAHGSAHPGRARLEELAARLEEHDDRVFAATLEDGGWDGLLEKIRSRGLDKVWLLPLLLAPGRHMQRDILGPGPESLAETLSRGNIQYEVLEQGMADRDDVAAVWISHLDTALDAIFKDESSASAREEND